ncbi:uncharacterized protein LOC125651581 [Ostrea edulis]|uniref:uncharacterized protein LOC125651581 n=1 Tax=Ostrea edulis TaxID=37623 RepID=UPI002095D87B|nr:uncharacterized protein LOC125651581 [Ostrea edulis]
MSMCYTAWVIVLLLLQSSDVKNVLGGPSVRFQEQDCHDKLGRGCFKYTDDQCVGKYTLWARENCALRCGYCPQKLPCVDHITYCDEYEERLCTEERYGQYMRENCRKTCNLCQIPTEYLTLPTTMSTTAVSSWCYDNVTDNSCWYYGDEQCTGRYELWARKFCPYRCGYCPDAVPPCEDAISYCGSFDRSLCTQPTYAAYMRENCRKTCQLCSYPGKILPPNTSPSDPSTPVTDEKIPQTFG